MGPGSSQGLLFVAWVLFLVFGGLAVLTAFAIIGLRTTRRATASRRERRTGEVRSTIVEALLGGDEAAVAAADDLALRRGRRWDAVEEEVLAMLPKVQGEARQHGLALLERRGAARHALEQTVSRRSLVRCRGAFALGVLGAVDAVPRLMLLVGDRSFAVRRVAARALGNIGDPRATRALLECAHYEPALLRDVGYALYRIGAAGAPDLRAAVARTLEEQPAAADGSMSPDDGHLRGAALAAATLGRIDDVASAPLLAEAVRRGAAPVRLAAAEALGALDAPGAVPALTEALHAESHPVRIAAAAALGRLGEPVAAPALAEAVSAGASDVARTAADALLKLGPDGRLLLETSPSPYAREALALAALRGGP